MGIKDYQDKTTKYNTRCKCGATVEWVQKFSAPIDKVKDYVYKEFGWTLFPSRCPKCVGTDIEVKEEELESH